MINWNGYNPENTAVHCPTKELAIKVLKIAKNAGLTWRTGRDLENENHWREDTEETCYTLRTTGVCYAYRDLYIANGYAILNADLFVNWNISLLYAVPEDTSVDIGTGDDPVNHPSLNREILFRGRTEYNKWVVGSLVIDAFGNHFIYAFELSKYGQSQEENRYSVIPETVGQFTGLMDKEGNKIFEGDILRTMSGIAVVVWLDAAFALESPGSEAVDWEHSSVYEQSEILGNIHQTPELYRDGWRDCCKDQKGFD